MHKPDRFGKPVGFSSLIFQVFNLRNFPKPVLFKYKSSFLGLFFCKYSNSIYLCENLNLKTICQHNTTQHNTTQHNTTQFNSIRIALLFLISSMLAACNMIREISPDAENNSNQMTARAPQQVSFQNGRLVFANANVFVNVMSNLAQNPSKIDSLENLFPQYTSWRKYNQERWNDSSATLLKLCEDCLELPNFYTTLLNDKQEYQIGETIIFVNDSKAYNIPLQEEKNLKVNGKFEVSRMSNITYDIIQNERVEPQETQRNFADAKYQYQYNFGGHTYKQVFEIMSFKIKPIKNNPTEISYLYLKMKLEYLKRRTFGGDQWLPAGENRVTYIDYLSGFSQYDSFSFTNAFHNINRPYTTQNRDTEIYFNEVSGSNLNTSRWTYNLNSYLMHLYVPSHNQGLGPVSGGAGLYVPNAFWSKTNP
jgi:hypothetical protein